LLAGCGGTSEPSPTIGSVDVTPTTAEREVGETVQLGAAVKDTDGNIMPGQSVTWSTSAAGVASVSTSGLVTANALGTAIVTANAGNRSGNATITVVPEPIASIEVTPTNDTLLVDETLQLSPTLRDAGGSIVTDRPVAWSSGSPNVATVSGSGLVTGVSEGLATITASADGRSASASIRVFSRCSTALVPTITVGQTVNGTLATTDCQLNDDTYADGYALMVAAATNVQIDMTASFDTYLFLLELLPSNELVQVAANDDVDPDDPDDPNDPFDTNSRITFTLQAGGAYFILANSFDPDVTGDYQVTVIATGGFIARQAEYTKPGKAPVSKLLKSIKPPR
jgi:hypothetical protein